MIFIILTIEIDVVYIKIYILVIQSCTRNLVSFGSGKMRIFNKEKC